MSPAAVAHYLALFLPLAEGWIYDQLRYARDIRSIVLTKKIANERQFPWPAIYSTQRSVWQEMGRAVRGFYPLHAEACRRQEVQLLHAHFGNRGVFARPLAAHLGIPLVTSFYGRDLRSAEPYARLFRDGARFLAEGPASRARLIELGCPPEKIRIHRLGVDPSEIEFRPRSRRAGEPLRILMAGRFVEKKGFIYGVRAVRHAARSAPIELTIAGGGSADPRERQVERELREAARDASAKINFAGWLPTQELLATASSHHIVLQPSVVAADGDREGGHPVVLTLLAAAGMPAIATRHGDIPEIVIEGRTGWLCEERDEECLAAAILEAYESDLEPKSRAARELVTCGYDIRHQTLAAAYEGLL